MAPRIRKPPFATLIFVQEVLHSYIVSESKYVPDFKNILRTG